MGSVCSLATTSSGLTSVDTSGAMGGEVITGVSLEEAVASFRLVTNGLDGSMTKRDIVMRHLYGRRR